MVVVRLAVEVVVVEKKAMNSFEAKVSWRAADFEARAVKIVSSQTEYECMERERERKRARERERETESERERERETERERERETDTKRAIKMETEIHKHICECVCCLFFGVPRTKLV